MGAKENLELIEELQRALRDLDFERYGQLLADDATLRTGGVPAGLGGVLTGRQAIVDQFRLTGGRAASRSSRSSMTTSRCAWWAR
jgi:hypothetical protein